jgi:hypothetical protein
MSGKRSRNKGHNFERLIANLFRDELGYKDARRHLEYHKDDANGIDIDNTGEFKIQCKRNKDWASISKILEVQLENGDDIEVLITKGDKKPAMIIMPLDKWIKREKLIKFKLDTY